MLFLRSIALGLHMRSPRSWRRRSTPSRARETRERETPRLAKPRGLARERLLGHRPQRLARVQRRVGRRVEREGSAIRAARPRPKLVRGQTAPGRVLGARRAPTHCLAPSLPGPPHEFTTKVPKTRVCAAGGRQLFATARAPSRLFPSRYDAALCCMSRPRVRNGQAIVDSIA